MKKNQSNRPKEKVKEWGAMGGTTAASKMSAEERKKRAKAAANARWAYKRGEREVPWTAIKD